MSWEDWFSIYKCYGQSGAEKHHRRLQENSSKTESLSRHVENDDVTTMLNFRCVIRGRWKTHGTKWRPPQNRMRQTNLKIFLVENRNPEGFGKARRKG